MKIIKNGFTLIELLVVISIIGILAAMATLSFTSAQRQARDVTRKSDLAQYRTALEMFANKNNGLYPTSSATSVSRIDPKNLCTTLELGTNCPADPKTSDSNYYYSYITDVAAAPLFSAQATQYVLWAKLENVTTSPTYWVLCSGGKSGVLATGVTPSTGACPI